MPAEASLVVGENLELDFVPRAENGDALLGRSVAWSVVDAQVASVNSNGLLLALATGETLVRARSEGVTGEGMIEVLPAPAIELVPDTVRLRALRGSGAPPPDSVLILNSGSGILSGLNTAIGYAEGQPAGWLRADLSGTTAPARLVFRAEVGQRPQGTYDASVEVRSGVAVNSPGTVRVTLIVGEPPPRIDLEFTEVLFTAPQGATAPATIDLAVANGGGGQLVGLTVGPVQYRAGEDRGDLPWLQATLEGTAAPTTVTLLASTGGVSGLAPGTYHAVVPIAAPGASNAPATVAVTFQITP
jgi:hypothetical protein